MKNVFNSHELEVSSDNRKKITWNVKQKINYTLKELSLIGFLTMIFFSFSYAQKGDITKRLRLNSQNTTNEVSKIPSGTINEFTQDFSNVHNAMWKVEEGYDEVDFNMNNKAMMAFYRPLGIYNSNDDLIGSGYYLNYADLPEKGREHIAKDYPDYTAQKAMFYDNNIDNDDDILNLSGNFLQKDSYFVLLKKDMKEIVMQITKDGDVSYFSNVPKKM